MVCIVYHGEILSTDHVGPRRASSAFRACLALMLRNALLLAEIVAINTTVRDSDVFIVQSGSGNTSPNDALMELLIICNAVRYDDTLLLNLHPGP